MTPDPNLRKQFLATLNTMDAWVEEVRKQVEDWRIRLTSAIYDEPRTDWKQIRIVIESMEAFLKPEASK